MATPVRTALTTSSSKTSGSSVNTASVTVNAGEMLVVMTAYDDVTLNSITWNGLDLDIDTIAPVLGAGVRTRIGFLVAPSTASSVVTLTWASAITAKAWAVSKITNVTMVDVSTGTSGTSGSPSSGNTATTTHPVAMLIGAIGAEGPSGDTAGTWSNSYTAGQRSGTTGNPAASNVTIAEGFRAVSSTIATAAAKTGMTSRDWGAINAAFVLRPQKFGQAQARIKAVGVQGYGQAQADIKQTYRIHAQAQAHIVVTSRAFGQAQAKITTGGGGTSYSDIVIADGPSAYWKLDEASGNFIDEISGLVLTPGNTGNVTYSVTGSGAGVEPGTTWSGANAGATSPDTSALNVGNGPFSVEMWFKRTRTAATEYLMAKHANPGVTDVGWRFTIASSDDTVRFSDGGGGTMARTSAGITDTNWHHVVFTKNGSTQKMYLDGSDVSAGVNVHTLSDATDQFVLAQSPSNGSRFIGSIDDVAIYKTDLTLTQVQNHYNNKDATGGGGATTTRAFGQAQAWIKKIGTTSSAQAQARIRADGALVWVQDTFSRSASVMGTPDVGPPYDVIFTDGIITVSGSVLGITVEDVASVTSGTVNARLPIAAKYTDTKVEFTVPIATDTFFLDVIIGARMEHVSPITDVAYLEFTTDENLGTPTLALHAFNDDDSASFPVVEGGIYVLKLRMDNGRVSGKMWRKINEEPDAWNLTLSGSYNNLGGNSAYVVYQISNEIDTDPVLVIDNFSVTEVLNVHFGQAQADIKQTYNVHGQAQADIKATSRVFAQAQADIKATSTVFGQAQADIKQIGRGFGQAQANIKQTYTDKTGQAQADIKATRFILGQAQADIKQTYQVFGQAQADIKTTSNVFGQAQADIKATRFILGQAQANIKQTYRGYGQSQADIKQTYPLSGLTTIAQDSFTDTDRNLDTHTAEIGGTWTNVTSPKARVLSNRLAGPATDSNSLDILNSVAFTEGDIYITLNTNGTGLGAYVLFRYIDSVTYYRIGITGNVSLNLDEVHSGGFSALVSPVSISGATNSDDIRIHAYISGTSPTVIKVRAWKVGNSEPSTWDIDTSDSTSALQVTDKPIGVYTRRVAIAGGHNGGDDLLVTSGQIVGGTFGQAQATIIKSLFVHGQAQANIKTTRFILGQAQAAIKQTYRVFGQTQADIKQTYTVFGQAQARIKNTYNGFGQANADIKATSTNYSTPFGQAQADIKATSVRHGQAQADIKQTYNVHGQAQATIAKTSFALGQAQAWIKTTYRAHGQANADIKATSTNYSTPFGQAQADIKQTYTVFGQAQARIKQTYNAHGQAQASIKTTYVAHGQAQVDIKQIYYVHGQANAWIKSLNNVHGQAQARIKNTYTAFGQAQAQIYISQAAHPDADISVTGWIRTVI